MSLSNVRTTLGASVIVGSLIAGGVIAVDKASESATRKRPEQVAASLAAGAMAQPSSSLPAGHYYHADPEIERLIAALRPGWLAPAKRDAELIVEHSDWNPFGRRHYRVKGRVLNNTSRSLNFVKVYITVFDASDKVLTTDWTRLNVLRLRPGQRAMFDFYIDAIPGVSSMKASFQSGEGRALSIEQVGEKNPLANKPLVRATQEALNALGFNAGKPDGTIGPKTRAALQEFAGRDELDKNMFVAIKDALKKLKPAEQCKEPDSEIEQVCESLMQVQPF